MALRRLAVVAYVHLVDHLHGDICTDGLFAFSFFCSGLTRSAFAECPYSSTPSDSLMIRPAGYPRGSFDRRTFRGSISRSHDKRESTGCYSCHLRDRMRYWCSCNILLGRAPRPEERYHVRHDYSRYRRHSSVHVVRPRAAHCRQSRQ